MIAATPRSPSCPTSLWPRPGPRCASRSASSARPPSPSPRRSPTTAARWRPPHAAAPPPGRHARRPRPPPGPRPHGVAAPPGERVVHHRVAEALDRRRGPPSGPSRSRRVARRRRSPHGRSRDLRAPARATACRTSPAGAQEPPSQSDDRRAARNRRRPGPGTGPRIGHGTVRHHPARPPARHRRRRARQTALASNLANANTPGFKPKDVDFHSALQAALRHRRARDGLGFAADDDAAAPCAPTATASTSTSSRPSWPRTASSTRRSSRSRAARIDILQSAMGRR